MSILHDISLRGGLGPEDRSHAGHIRTRLGNSILQKPSVSSLSSAKRFLFPKTTTVFAQGDYFISFIYFLAFFFLAVFRAAPAAYGGSRARGLVGAVAAGLHHSHSNARSEPSLQTAPELKARDQTCNLMVSSWIRFHCAMMGTPQNCF